MILWTATTLLFLALAAATGLARRDGWGVAVPDLDLVLLATVGLFARRERLTALLILLAGCRAAATGTPLAAALAAFLATGWLLAAGRNLLFRNRLPGRLILGFLGLVAVRLLLGLLDRLGRGHPFPGPGLWLAPAGVTTLWLILLLPLLCRLPPLSLHLERSRV